MNDLTVSTDISPIDANFDEAEIFAGIKFGTKCWVHSNSKLIQLIGKVSSPAINSEDFPVSSSKHHENLVTVTDSAACSTDITGSLKLHKTVHTYSEIIRYNCHIFLGELPLDTSNPFGFEPPSANLISTNSNGHHLTCDSNGSTQQTKAIFSDDCATNMVLENGFTPENPISSDSPGILLTLSFSKLISINNIHF